MKVGSLVRLKIMGVWYMATITAIENDGVQLWWLDGAPKQKRPYDWFKLEYLELHHKDKILEVVYEGR